jgi:hypothetical protein
MVAALDLITFGSKTLLMDVSLEGVLLKCEKRQGSLRSIYRRRPYKNETVGEGGSPGWVGSSHCPLRRSWLQGCHPKKILCCLLWAFCGGDKWIVGKG